MTDIGKEIISAEIKKSETEFKCFMCQKNFTYKDIVGQIQCFYHLDTFDQREGKYFCCGVSKNKKGCARCDHSETGVFFDIFRDIPEILYSEGIYKHPVLEYDEETGIYMYKKYNMRIFRVQVAENYIYKSKKK
jgi:hypothetical protein